MKKRPGRLFWWVLAGLPVLLYGGLLLWYGINIPRWDDHALRNFLVDFNQTPDWSEKVRLLLAQHNEHRIVYDRVVTLLTFRLTGEIDYLVLMILGSLSLVGLLGLLARIGAENGLPAALILPLSLFLFTLQHYENTFWGMAALQNFTVVFFLTAALYFLRPARPTSLPWAGGMAVAATLTSASGLVIWPVGAGLLLVQRRWRALGLWVLAGLGVGAGYFFGYRAPPGNPPTEFDSIRFWKGFLGFVGSAGDFFPESPARFGLPVALGLVMVTGGGLWGVRTVLGGFQKKKTSADLDYFALGVLAVVVSTGLVVVVGRLGFGDWVLLTSRVKIYSVLLLLTLLLGLFRWTRPANWPPLLWTTGGLGLLFSGYTLVLHLGDVKFGRQFLVASALNWPNDGPVPAYDRLRHPYRVPELVQSLGRVSAPNAAVFPLDSLRLSASGLQTGSDSVQTSLTPDEGAFLLLENDSVRYWFPTRPRRNRSRRSWLGGGGYFTEGFDVSIASAELPSGEFRVEVVTENGGQSGAFSTKQQIRISPQNRRGIPSNW